MDAAAFEAELEEARGTELERLGSNKLLVALTDADLTPGAVLRAAADSEHAAHVTFSEWAASEEDTGARELFGWVAEREADHRDRVLDSLEAMGESHEPNDGGTTHSFLRERADVVERVAAGLVGRTLVSERAHVQVVSFFVNEADETRADLFRALREETDEERERGLSLLEELCGNEDDWERARMVAEYVIQLAYDDYADALRGMDIDVKPVC